MRTVTVLRGTGPLKMWHVYCSRCGNRVASRNAYRDAVLAAAKHINRHAQKDDAATRSSGFSA